MLKRLIVPGIAGLLFFASCDVFVDGKGVDAIKAYEKKYYILKKDIDIEGKKLKKGEEVRIVVTPGKEWVKVHAYPSRANELKADRYLILYLFDDDFEKKQFSVNFFNEQLNAVVAARGDVPVIDKKKK